ncbi:TetR/AcrR family transcriptional regulator [Pararhodospirillum oryzae]|uniref:TetR family transcriptional regulator n=1 Tax=Pararhodospirillum oryzae TaxID=478448 RepID=A0A512H628_9PROT|nr:TetR/AcrR family transcriptional regulator [Pararhodospirillum oryzae]GEO80926.1 TetR family transcriptional regulator [Pararhodospirillum oryzae]
MARPRSFNCDEVLLAAMKVFWRQGYEASSMADLMAATGLSKSSLYGAFGSKHGLFLAAFEAYRDERRRVLHDLLAQGPTAFEAIAAFFHKTVAHALQGDRPFGCMSCNEAVELGPHDADVQRLVESDFQNIEEAFAAALARGRADGSIRPGDDRARARFMTVLVVGMHTMIRARVASVVLEDAVRMLLDSLAPPS